jgi:hypothetical protein
MHRPWILVAAFLLAASAARGQNSDEAGQIKVLLERIDQLENRVSQLEAKLVLTSNPPVSAATPLSAEKSEPQHIAALPGQGHEHEMQEQQGTILQTETHYPSLQIRGFGDVDFSATDRKGTNSGFNLGQLDLHLASPLSQKITYFAEITFNAHPDQYTVEVERSIIRYDYNDYFKMSFGRFHTPVGYWNTAFHHGAWLETTIDRPFQVRVGGTFTPLHLVGFLAEGNIPSGGVGLSYQVGVGNGRGELIGRPGDAGDINNNRAWVVNIFARPAKLYGLEVGASVYRDEVTLPGGQNFREWINSAYLVWTKGSPEFISEFDNVNHRNILTGQVANSNAFYTQFAYRLPWMDKKLKPYYRFEYVHMPFNEQVFVHQDLVQSIVGLRYDISNYAAFKGEYRNTKAQPGQLGQEEQPTVNGVFFQTAFTF